MRLPRRRLLRLAGWAAAGLTVAWALPRPALPILPSTAAPGADEGVAWLQLLPDGRLSLMAPLHELGQGSAAGLAQIAAEELNLALEAVDLRSPATAALPRMRFTTGSQGIALHAAPVARAAAALREALRARAAQRLGLPEAALAEVAGGFAAPDGRRLTYAALAAGVPVLLAPGRLAEARLHSFDPRRVKRQVGQPAPLPEARAIVTGMALFTADLRLPGMAYGRCVPPPLAQARLMAVETGPAARLPGVLQVVVDAPRGLVGVVAETPGTLDRAMAALRVTWDRPAPIDAAALARRLDVDHALGQGRLAHRILDEQPAPGAWDIDLRLDLPALHHAAQEPRAALARFGTQDGAETVEVWTGTQDLFVNHRKLAAELGLPEARVMLHGRRVGGAFGGRAQYDVVREAALLARAAGRPVKVVWSRADEFRADRARPPSSHRIRARADATGRLSDWWHAWVTGPVLLTEMLGPPWLVGAARLALADFGATRGILPPYAAPRRRIEMTDVDLPVPTGPWRGLGAGPNTLAIEVAMEALALRLGRDPVAFRLAHLGPGAARLAACLARARDLAAAVTLPPVPGFGRGHACGTYHETSHVACAADVAVDPATRAIRVLRFCCALDIGLAVNPDRVRAQIEGCVMMAIGQLLREEARIDAGGYAARRFADYPMAGPSDVPAIEIALLGDAVTPPAGAGEVALIAAVPALVNAVRDATGHAATRLPIRPADLPDAIPSPAARTP
ncbi:xanthine dehydrogenase family protein molybdopterin-binding subunit [Falsiroseomonas selenitidurans]|uniref:Molybdopterin-dependent oxidoreductase n=1 Tax=Falsiroseomonas selenitidurans TaxID=2716335 RepID=A0ABX1E3C6_9PROT|nr:molybdopterin cofactor-binding domain-containing protein [Falsiroseomonas selenitidurans]NKC31681.1 molybdopterin-dependent oxidoreductase [Falsiroseomonas selenitidurans]